MFIVVQMVTQTFPPTPPPSVNSIFALTISRTKESLLSVKGYLYGLCNLQLWTCIFISLVQCVYLENKRIGTDSSRQDCIRPAFKWSQPENIIELSFPAIHPQIQSNLIRQRWWTISLSTTIHPGIALFLLLHVVVVLPRRHKRFDGM